MSGALVWRSAGAVAAAAFGLVAYAYLTLPDVRSLRTGRPSRTAFMRLRAEEAAARGVSLAHAQRWLPYSRISPQLTRAVLVAEDDAFWTHDGVDYEQLKETIESDLARGRSMRGASTITQQLAKNLYLSPSRNPLRKLEELVIARRLEVELSKARILELYLNLIEWGDGVWGAEAAARRYFGVSATSLTAGQAALLAGAIINPRVHNPARPTKRLLRRQAIILRRMGRVTVPTLTAVAASPSLPDASPDTAATAPSDADRTEVPEPPAATEGGAMSGAEP